MFQINSHSSSLYHSHKYTTMKNTTLSRPAIRLLTYLCAAVCVSLIACPVADINRTAAENRCITVMRTGIDILTTAVSGIAEGEDITANLRAADGVAVCCLNLCILVIRVYAKCNV